MTSIGFLSKLLAPDHGDALKLSNFRETAEEEWLMKYGSLNYEDILGTELEHIMNDERDRFINLNVKEQLETGLADCPKIEEEKEFEKPRKEFKPMSFVVKLNEEISVVEIKKKPKNFKKKKFFEVCWLTERDELPRTRLKRKREDGTLEPPAKRLKVGS
eukprot:augustus_masked-scaffold_6-processed-gene-12.47-mRNA-1 protein AED:1.00 eAED:1.00 QI:0/-1/0/0/-1/1/1/0/159